MMNPFSNRGEDSRPRGVNVENVRETRFGRFASRSADLHIAPPCYAPLDLGQM